MNLRWFMIKHKMADHAMFLPVSLLFMSSFFVSRVVMMGTSVFRAFQSYSFYDIAKQPGWMEFFSYYTYLQLVLLYLLQIYWFWLILAVVIKTASGDKNANKKKV